MEFETLKKLVEDTVELLANWGYEKKSIMYGNVVDIRVENIQQEETHPITIRPASETFFGTPMVWISYGDNFGIPVPADPQILCAVIHHGC